MSLTAPASGASYNAPASITLVATAADADGTITQVQQADGSWLVHILGDLSGTVSGQLQLDGPQSATGALQAAQVNNQLLVQISQQLSDLIALEAANGRARALIDADRTTNQNQGATQLSTFLTPGAGYQPGNVQMFHGN